MPLMHDIRCKHCDSLIALIPLPAIVGRFTLECQVCKVRTAVWPLEKVPERVYTERQEVRV